jgi:glutathione S-transferase
MSLVFYYAPMSSAVTIHWALEELGIPYEKVRLDLQARDQDKPAFRALNPNGKVPLVVHDGTPIFESVAILLHLGEAFGVEKKLYPPPGRERGEAMKWIVWAGVSIADAASRKQHASSPKVPAERHNAKAAEAAHAEVLQLVGILDAALGKKKWLAGDAFSFADLYAASWVGYLGMLGFDTKAYANVTAWLDRCSSRPAYMTAMQP